MASPKVKPRPATEALLNRFEELVDSQAAGMNAQGKKALAKRLDAAIDKGRVRSRHRERA